MFLEDDLECPIEAHEQHEDFLLALEQYEKSYNDLSPINQFLHK